MVRELYQILASWSASYKWCMRRGEEDLAKKWEKRMDWVMREIMPSGSGIDNGTSVMLDECGHDKLVFVAPYHVMNDVGMYVMWVDVTIEVTASMAYGMIVEAKISEEEEKMLEEEYEVSAERLREYMEDLYHEVLSGEYDKYDFYERANE